jgi:hypothetical protein
MVSLVPKLRIKLTRFHGVLAPNSMYRTLVTPAKRGRGKVKSLNKIADQAPAEKRASWTWVQRLNLQDTLTSVKYGVFSHYKLCVIKLNTARVNNILRKLLDTRSVIADTS